MLDGLAIGWHNGDLVTGFGLAIGMFGIALLVFSLLGLVLIDPERSRRELTASTHGASSAATSPA
ncbi:hypothetical protein [Pseudomonas hygromyciniae]|uniref:hypothetical protein n=1 Tax=Pseudomonas hygromyciniae TaxID=2812000 RepID=UPI001F0809D8|nr:hypothetical protein [Pseudomonas hygromyciniae]